MPGAWTGVVGLGLAGALPGSGLGLGLGSGLGSGLGGGALVVGPVQFERGGWLVLAPALIALTWLIGRRSLAGLGGATKWTALAVRALVILLLVGALAEPSLRRTSTDIAVNVVLDASRSIPRSEQDAVDAYIREARAREPEEGRLLGVVTAAKEAYVQATPSERVMTVERQYLGDTGQTDLAAGVRLAVAVAKQDAATRLLLITDGNETSGSLLAAAEAARAVNMPIDVLPVRYDYPAEVIVERVLAPANARGGETINVAVIASATAATRGRLLLTMNGEPVDLDPSPEALGAIVELAAGKNALSVPVEPTRPGPQTFEAVFEPLGSADAGVGDSIAENNRAAAVTFVGSEGWVLVVSASEAESGPLVGALTNAGIKVREASPPAAPTDLTEFNAYEAVVLVNIPADEFSEPQMEALRRYVHDSGGGLVVVGGPSSYGAGGWIGTPIEDALPVRLDPPQKRQMPKGALALVIHSVEAPNGVYWGKQVCNAAVDALSSQDLAGIVEFDGRGTDWTHPLRPVGDRAAVKRAISNLQYGDMPSFDPSLELALQGLVAADAGQRHCIVISDGDPSLNRGILGKFRQAGVTISAVGVFPHSPGDVNTLRNMATATGGNYYGVNSQAGLATLPQIFIKEARTVRRSLIWEGPPFSPKLTGVPTETMRGISAVPPISGYVVTAAREGLAVTTLLGTEEDPVCAQWQYGLGRAVAFTSDATSRWATAWTGWSGFEQFWEQHVRWAMRPSGSANVRVTTEARGDETLLVVEALDEGGERLNFARFQARVAAPDGTAQDVELKQVGPGRYETVMATTDAGAYVVSMRYRAPRDEPGLPPIEGTVQAAVTRPAADEFRALETNVALLRQVAALTGGRVLERDPVKDALWSEQGLTRPVSTRAIWMTVAVCGLGLFLFDVAVRRVRIDVLAGLRAVRRGLAKGEAKPAGEQLGSLREARAQAQARLTQRAVEATVASRKFEAGADVPVSASPVALAGEAEKPKIEGLSKPAVQAAKKGAEEEAGMSRLMAAKKRAREEFGE